MGASIVKLLNIGSAPQLPPAPRGAPSLPPAPATPPGLRPGGPQLPKELEDDLLEPLPATLPPPSAPTVRAWLDSLGLAPYAANFERERISLADLPLLAEPDLERLGLPLGPRRRVLASVGALWQQLHGISTARPVRRVSSSNATAAAAAPQLPPPPPGAAGATPPELPPAPPGAMPAAPAPSGLLPAQPRIGSLSSDFLDSLSREFKPDAAGAWEEGFSSFDRASSNMDMWLPENGGAAGAGARPGGALRSRIASVAYGERVQREGLVK